MATHTFTRSEAFPRAGRFPRSHSPVAPTPEGHAHEGGTGLPQWLGWLSIGLGATALAVPRGVARAIGARGDATDEAILRLVGLQELVCGVGLLRSRRPADWTRARVAGDAMHLTMLGGTLLSGPRRPDRMAATTAAITGIAAVDVASAVYLSRQRGGMADDHGPMEIHHAITINRPAAELYQFWRNFENLPRIMTHLESVRVTGERTSHWEARGPAGMTVSWEAEITEDRPNERIAWQSIGGQVDTTGSVRFIPAPGGRGTEVHVALTYDPPGGIAGKWFARLFGESPDQQVYDELSHFKQVMETGDVVRSSPTALSGRQVIQWPAQPRPDGTGGAQ